MAFMDEHGREPTPQERQPIDPLLDRFNELDSKYHKAKIGNKMSL